MIQIPECRIHNVRKNKYQNLLVTVEIKKEDYTREQEDTLFDKSADGQSLAMVLNPFGEVPEVNEGELRMKLAGLMKTYCENQNLNFDEELERFYKKEGIQSRSELTGDKLKNAIEAYRSGLIYNE